MTRRLTIAAFVATVMCLVLPRQCLSLDLAFKQQYNQMCRAPLLRDSPEVSQRKLDASQAAAKQIVARGASVVPTVMMEVGPWPRLRYAQGLLAAIGEPSHDALRKALPGARGTLILSTIGRMRYEAKPLIPDLLQQLQRIGRKTKFDGIIIATLVKVGADRKKMAARLNAIITAPQSTTDLLYLAPALVELGPDAAPVMPAVRQWLTKHPDVKHLDIVIREFPRLGPVVAPLTQVLADYYKANPGYSGFSTTATLVFGGIGPGAKASLPLLKTWWKKVSARSRDARDAIMIETAIACIEGRPGAVVARLKKLIAAALGSTKTTANLALHMGMRAIAMIAHSHPKTARSLMPLVSRTLRARRRLTTVTAAMTVRDLKPALALSVLPDLIQSASGVYDGDKPSYSSSYYRSVQALRQLAPYDKRARAALERLSKTDPHILIRTMAREAVVYADAVGPLTAK